MTCHGMSRSTPARKWQSLPISVSESYVLGAGEDPQNKTHIVLGWLLGLATDPVPGGRMQARRLGVGQIVPG